MIFYLRKITRGRWPGEKLISETTPKDIEADTLFSEIQTDNNKLSVWKASDENDINDIFVALASNCKNISTISAIKINECDVKNLLFEKEDGDTPTFGINQKHRNITCLNYGSLGDILFSIIKAFNNDGYIRKTKSEMKRILANAYKSGKIDKEHISPDLEREINEAINKGYV